MLKKLAGEKAQAILAVYPITTPPLACALNHSFRVVNGASLHIRSCPHISVPSALVSTLLLFERVVPLTRGIIGPLPQLPETPSQGDNTLILALEALAAQDYPHSVTFVNEAIEQGISWDAGKAEALNLRGTFRCVHFTAPPCS